MMMIQAPRPLGVGGAVADILACPPRSDYDIPGMDGDGGGGDGERGQADSRLHICLLTNTPRR